MSVYARGREGTRGYPIAAAEHKRKTRRKNTIIYNDRDCIRCKLSELSIPTQRKRWIWSPAMTDLPPIYDHRMSASSADERAGEPA